MHNPWIIRIFTFLLWALAAGSAAFWALQSVNATSSRHASNTKTLLTLQTDSIDVPQITPKVALALGAKGPITLTAANLASTQQARFQLQGVLAVGSQNGAALISVDGKPAKPYRLGSVVEDGLQVVSLKGRTASLGQNDRIVFTLELPLKSTGQSLSQTPTVSMRNPTLPPPPATMISPPAAPAAPAASDPS